MVCNVFVNTRLIFKYKIIRKGVSEDSLPRWLRVEMVNQEKNRGNQFNYIMNHWGETATRFVTVSGHFSCRGF